MKMFYFVFIIQVWETSMIDLVIIIIYCQSSPSERFFHHSYPSHSTSMEIHIPFYQPVLSASMVLQLCICAGSSTRLSCWYREALSSLLKYQCSIVIGASLLDNCINACSSPHIICPSKVSLAIKIYEARFTFKSTLHVALLVWSADSIVIHDIMSKMKPGRNNHYGSKESTIFFCSRHLLNHVCKLRDSFGQCDCMIQSFMEFSHWYISLYITTITSNYLANY